MLTIGSEGLGGVDVVLAYFFFCELRVACLIRASLCRLICGGLWNSATGRKVVVFVVDWVDFEFG